MTLSCTFNTPTRNNIVGTSLYRPVIFYRQRFLLFIFVCTARDGTPFDRPFEIDENKNNLYINNGREFVNLCYVRAHTYSVRFVLNYAISRRRRRSYPWDGDARYNNNTLSSLSQLFSGRRKRSRS